MLVVSTLLPAAFVLWFMNEAITTQAASARQQVVDAYRGQLRLVRSRIDAHWREQAARLDGEDGPEARFLALTGQEGADGGIVLAADGHVEYPDRTPRAQSARPTIERRLVAAERDPGAAAPIIRDVADRLNDYRVALSAADRLALMERLRMLAPNVFLPTQAALRLSFDLVEAERPVAAPDAFRETALRDVWALTSPQGRVIALYRTGRLEALLHDFLHQVQPAGIVFIATPPDVPASADAIAAGSWLPGWQITYEPIDRAPYDEAARRQRTLYVSVALAGIAVIAVVGVAGGGMIRRHLRLARAKTDLVAAASHELRTPLASMRVLVDGLLADTTFDPIKTREYLEIMAAENARLSRLLDNFLTFARLERARYQFDFVPTPPSQVVASAIDAIGDRRPAACELIVDVEPDVPLVMADPDALCTALVNLLDNAIKYTPADTRIHLRATRDEAGVCFVVQDNGIGIPVREQRRIFRRFYRVDQRLSRETTGVGLGLSIVELIVKAHGGTVTVRSEPGKGSTFAVRVPRATEGATA